jgi:Tfp pilus assembly protein PilF
VIEVIEKRRLHQPAVLVSLYAAFLLIALWLVYARAFGAPFYFDTVTHLQAKTNLHLVNISWQSLVDAIRVDFRAPPFYRPVSQLSLAFTHYWFGLTPKAFRIGNLFIHWGASLVLVFLFLSILRAPRIAKTCPEIASSALPLALIATALWSLHPVQTNVVTYVIQRAASMAGLFSFLTAGAYLRARTAPQGWCWRWGLLSLASFGLAVGSKENAVTLVPALLACEAILLEPPLSPGVRRGLVATWCLVLFSAAATLLVTHEALIRYFSYSQRSFTVVERLLTESRLQGDYLRLLLIPDPSLLILTADVEVSRSISHSPATSVALGLLVAAVAIAVLTARKQPLLSFSILWYFAHQLVESTVLPLELYYEHRLYLPSVTLYLFLTVSLWQAARKRRHGLATSVCLLSLFLAAEAWGTYERNGQWANPVAFWSDALTKAPTSARIHTNLGTALLQAGRLKEADRYLERALTLEGGKPWIIHLQLARTAYWQGHRDEARRHLEESLRLVRRTNWEAPRQLGLLALQDGQLEEAERYLRMALKQRAGDPEAHRLLALVRMRRGDLEGAEEELQSALRYAPDLAETWNTLGAVSYSRGRYAEAAERFARALSLNPSKAEYRDNFERARSGGRTPGTSAR